MRSILRLVRWQNILFLGILLWVMIYWVSQPVIAQYMPLPMIPWYIVLLLEVSVLCIAAGGYVINDYFDVKIDRINRPDRIVVTNTLSKLFALRLFQCLTVTGMLTGFITSWLCHSLSLVLVFLFVPGLLWFYSASYKRMFLVGNLIIAFCVALVPLLVAMVQVGWLTNTIGEIITRMPFTRELYGWVGGFALFAFLTTLIREVIKDLQDQTGDRELECHTLPIVIGDVWTKVIITILILVTVVMLIYFWWFILPFESSWHSLSTRYLFFGLIVPLCCELALLWTAKISSDYQTAQGLMKFIMFIGILYGYVINRLL